MLSRHLLLCCAIGANLVLTIGAGCATKASTATDVASASMVPLADTHWRLTQLGDEVVANPEGDRAIGLRLQSQDSRATGFSGCNRMFGAYALDGQSLKFAEIGSTKMACLDPGLMRLEQRYLGVFRSVAGWRITDRTLELLDADDKAVATFVASADSATSSGP